MAVLTFLLIIQTKQSTQPDTFYSNVKEYTYKDSPVQIVGLINIKLILALLFQNKYNN